MTLSRLAIMTALLLSSACFDSDDLVDNRAALAEVVCDDGVCLGRWDGTDTWSVVMPAEDLEGDTDPATVWPCDPAPDVDACGVIDTVGHLACWQVHDGWAVAVAPECAVDDTWTPIGLGMMSREA